MSGLEPCFGCPAELHNFINEFALVHYGFNKVNRCRTRLVICNTKAAKSMEYISAVNEGVTWSHRTYLWGLR